jgi:hypothetical protein
MSFVGTLPDEEEEHQEEPWSADSKSSKWISVLEHHHSVLKMRSVPSILTL